MSYCRFGWGGSDVYVYGSDRGLECCGCKISYNEDSGEWFSCDTPSEMLAHLAEHKKAGHFVPFYAIRRLWLDIEGPNKAVRPEPEIMTQTRLMMRAAMSELRKEKKEAARGRTTTNSSK